MFRRIIGFTVVITLFANQAAMCCMLPHHETTKDGHSTQRHLHLPCHAHDAIERHDHGLPKNEDSQSCSDLPSKIHLVLQSICPVNHQCKTIILAEKDYLYTQSNRLTIIDTAPTWICSISRQAGVESLGRHPLQPVDPVATRPCAIYLYTRHLLI